MDQITVTVVTVTITRDKYGDATRSETRVDVPGCIFAPQNSLTRLASSAHTDPHLPEVDSLALVLMPADSVVRPNDYLLIGTARWNVLGEPAVWGHAGIEVAVKRWEQP